MFEFISPAPVSSAAWVLGELPPSCRSCALLGLAACTSRESAAALLLHVPERLRGVLAPERGAVPRRAAAGRVVDWSGLVWRSPRAAQTRFSTKYRHRDGALVLKVTDDVRVRAASRAAAQPPPPPLTPPQCLKFQTDQTADLKKVETVTALFLSLMARGMDTPYGARADRRDRGWKPAHALLPRADDLLTLPPSAAAAGGAGKGGKGGGGKGKGGGSRKG